MDVDFDLAEVIDLGADLKVSAATVRQELTTFMRQSGNVMHQEASNESPVDSGNMKGLIRVDSPVTHERVSVTSHADYSKAVHDGSGPHIIRPRSKRALFWPGARHPVKYVNHPGNKANPFMQRALVKAMRRLEPLAVQAGVKIARKAIGLG